MINIPPCGGYCKSCILYKKACVGCIETNGKPFHLKKAGKEICPVWQCVTEYKLEHCGICEEFPCNKFLSWFDPKRGITTVLRRAGLLALRKKIGTGRWIKWVEDKKIEFGV